VVVAPVPLARSRLMARNGLAAAAADQRIHAQMSNAERARGADVLVSTEWGVADTAAQLARAWSGLPPRARAAAESLAALGWLGGGASSGVGFGPGRDGCSAMVRDWGALCAALAVPPRLALLWWRRLRAPLAGAGRHYHTLDHLQDMLRHLHKVDAAFAFAMAPSSEGGGRDRLLLRLAVYFHDAVYEVHGPGLSKGRGGGGGGSNEQRSARLFREFAAQAAGGGGGGGGPPAKRARTSGDGGCDGGLSAAEVEAVAGWIERTERHMSGKAAGALAVFLDADLCVLARHPAAYAEYTHQIRAEYAHVPEAAFRSGRYQAMKSFLGSPQLYFTEAARTGLGLEERARANVAAELQRLQPAPASGL
jgi:predicted metal-dependent HD superfamily phosphohydrolase